MDGQWDETREVYFIFWSADHDSRVRSMKSVASCSLWALWLPCVTHDSSMLHSLLPSVCLYVSLLIPCLYQPCSPSSSCCPLSLPQARILLPPSLPLLLPLISQLDILFVLSFFLPLSPSLSPFFHQWTVSTDFPTTAASSSLSLLFILSCQHLSCICRNPSLVSSC